MNHPHVNPSHTALGDGFCRFLPIELDSQCLGNGQTMPNSRGESTYTTSSGINEHFIEDQHGTLLALQVEHCINPSDQNI